MTQPQPLVATKLAKQKIHYKMVQAQDLRLENLILKDGKIVSVIAINSTEIATDDNNGFYFEEVFEPIPLSPKILEAAGFKYGKVGKKKDDSFVEYWDRSAHLHKHSFGRFTFSIVRFWNMDKAGEFTFSHHQIRSDCKYVHELQNLWFTLTGEELTTDINALTEKV